MREKGFLAKSTVAASILILIMVSLNAVNIQIVQAQEQLAVTFNVSNDGEYTHVTGTVVDANQEPVEWAEVSIQVDDPSGETIHLELKYTDQNGEFTDSFKTPEEVNGECTIYVSARKTGYENGYAQAAFTAVPEFSVTFIVAIAAILLTLLMLKKGHVNKTV